MKKILLSLGTAIAVVAPIATIVACNNSSSGKAGAGAGAGSSNGTIDGIKTVSHASSSSFQIKEVPANLKPFSITSIKEEAIRENDDSGWGRNGIAYHALYATTSLLRSLSDKYGYSTKDATGISEKDKSFENKSLTLIDENSVNNNLDSNSKFNTDPSKLKAAKFIASLTRDESKAQKTVHIAVMGDDGYLGYDSLINYGFTSKYPMRAHMDGTTVDNSIIEVDVDGDGTYSTSITFDTFSNWDKLNEPGIMKLGLVDQEHGIAREIDINHFSNAYTSIKTAKDQTDSNGVKFEDDVAPYVKAALIKFVELYKDFPGALDLVAQLAGGVPDPTFADRVNFILEKNTKNGVFQFDDAVLSKYLSELNDGSIHWLAIKAFYQGLDSTFVTSEYAPFAIYSDWLDSDNKTLKGLKDSENIFGIKPWAHFASLSDLVVKNLPLSFRADKTAEELFTEYKYPYTIDKVKEFLTNYDAASDKSIVKVA